MEKSSEGANAHAAGQTEYTIADASGKAGERKLAAIAKVPGPAREQIAETLANRDLNMPQRVGGELGQALGAPARRAASGALINRKPSREAGPLYRRPRSWSGLEQAIKDIVRRSDRQAGLKRGFEIQRIAAAGQATPHNQRNQY